MPVLDPYGIRRVVKPGGVLPQAAEVLDPHLPLADDELEVDVDHINVDAASFRQIEDSVGRDPQRIADRIREIVSWRGKLHNPVTGSGGMLIGRVRSVGPAHPAASTLHGGVRVASLASLTLTPLVIDALHAVHPDSERVDVTGRAILFASAAFAVLPDDLPELVSLAVLDVCGAPAWVRRLARPEATVLVIGAGKSGSLACAAARDAIGPKGRILVLDRTDVAPKRLVAAGLADDALAVDATRPLDVHQAVRERTGGALCDLVVNCASVPGTEMSAVLSARDGGAVLYFSMATSFTAAALGAEGLSRDVTLYIGNGYAPGHAEYALDLVRRLPALRRLFEERVQAG